MVKGHTTTVRRPLSELNRTGDWFVTIVSSPDLEAIGRRERLSDEGRVVGRGPDCTLQVDDGAVSRRHFRIFRPIGVERFWIEDLGGANGTFVEGERLSGRRALEGYEVVWAGDTVFVIEAEHRFVELAIAHDATGERAARFRGQSVLADQVRRALETAATADGAVLLLGPSGAGKEVSARVVHDLSGRTGPFVPVNCAAIPSELAEAELFGHAKGAFTGADQPRTGHFRDADGGTLFLDEVAELPLPMQAKLLRVLETGIVTPIAGAAVQVDVRVVAATNQPIEGDEDGFRQDLLARLSDWVVRLPPLRQRRADIVPLFEHFWAATGRDPVDRTARFDAALTGYEWPLNVRELEKLARRSSRLVKPGAALDLLDLPPAIRGVVLRHSEARESTPSVAEKTSADVPTKDALEEALRRERGNVKAVADAHRWHRMQVYRWMRRYELDPSDYR